MVAHSADRCDLAYSAKPSFCSTSWATPAVAGAAALVRQYFMEGRYPSGKATDAKHCPSGALVKAVLLNGAMDMARIADGSEQYPNKIEGWGRLNLDRSLYVEGEPGYRRVRVLDFWMANGLAQGESFCRKVKVGSAKEPLHVTLVWTDPPPANVCHKSFVVNDLDLTLTQGAALYYGNFFNRKTVGSSKQEGARIH